MKKRVKFHTLGCKTNQYETQAIRESLISLGSFVEVASTKPADVYVINTCTVTAKADRDCRVAIRHYHRENPNAKIVATGCLAEMDEDMIRALPGVSLVVKNSEKHKIRDILTNHKSEITNHNLQRYAPLRIRDFEGRSRAFVKVQDGCSNFCSYCKIPLVRGRSKSRDLKDILEEVNRLLDSGFKELILTGICLGDWGRDLSGDLKLHDLIRKIGNVDRDFRMRLSSIEPNMVTDELVKTIAVNKKICPHLHIPLQSGSDNILRLMNRPYTGKDYIKIVKKIRKIIPNIAITSDVMVGFPGESERDFKKTLKLIRWIRPSRLHIFSYSQRNGTQASTFKNNLTNSEIKIRRNALEDAAQKASYQYRKRFLHKRIEGLVETERDPSTNLLTGYTERYIRFLLDGPNSLMGTLVPIKIYNLDSKSTFCKLFILP